jgi:preprotein translocase subunit SecA
MPVLVGTISIEKSEQLSKYLKKFGIKHNVLNAKHHEQEAEIIAQAGQNGAVTIATNMAGRGTDIVLGEGVPELGGLHILGTERHESRRIDNQLRGRSGRQGDKGSSRFYLSLEDDLLRIFGSDRISGFMAKLGMENGQPIEHAMVSKAVENAQRKVEAHNFDIRKHLLEYDDVMNRQREIIYALRRDILTGENQKDILYDMADEVLEETLAEVIPKGIYPEEWDIDLLNENLERLFDVSIKKIDDQTLQLDGQKEIKLEDCKAEELHEEVFGAASGKYDLKEKEVGPDLLRYPERMIMLQVLDNLWREHLLAMDHLKEGIGLRGYAQKNPLNEYKKEGFDLFRQMNFRMKEEICEFLFKAQINREAVQSLESHQDKEERKVMEHRGEGSESQKPAPVKRDENKVGRNDPCPCGSGKKYKKCHGK